MSRTSAGVSGFAQDHETVRAVTALGTAERPRPPALRDCILLVLVTVACLAPFLGKAFYIDDPLFLWSARQIQAHPADFFGFDVNWYGTEMPMCAVTKNPPLTCYYVAAAAGLLGWSEAALHGAFLLPALATALGAWFLARRFCAHPLLAALAGVLTPVFIVSSTTLMCDTMMLAFWCWAAVLWFRGMDRRSPNALLGAALLASLASLTKYFGICLVPLLFVYSVGEKRRIGYWTLYLAIPVLVMLGYELWTQWKYGLGLLGEASGYAVGSPAHGGGRFLSGGLVALLFAGGCLITPFFFAPFLWSRRALMITGAVVVLAAVTVSCSPDVFRLSLSTSDGVRWGAMAHFVIFAAAGVHILALCASELRRRIDGASLFLGLWVIGTIVFTAFLNWTVNARSLLPAAPAVGILLARKIECSAPAILRRWKLALAAPLLAGAAISLVVAWADYQGASAARAAARAICARYAHRDAPLWFEGHWGFQYYMEAGGARPTDYLRVPVARGQYVIVPSNNANVFEVPRALMKRVAVVPAPATHWIATMSRPVNAGFYASVFGGFPFVFGAVPDDYYEVYRLVRDSAAPRSPPRP